MGSIVDPVLKLCDVHTYKVERPEDVADTAAAAIDLAFSGDIAAAVLLSQKLIGRKVWVK
jgi:sulfopyruvate decarboxylase TPP-binding subunit